MRHATAGPDPGDAERLRRSEQFPPPNPDLYGDTAARFDLGRRAARSEHSTVREDDKGFAVLCVCVCMCMCVYSLSVPLCGVCVCVCVVRVDDPFAASCTGVYVCACACACVCWRVCV